ncbi:ssx2ip-a [Scenedesmus sp. PABB004]|nr:ssx2ip-a [Scenedesmus sp. PABB004]
MASAGLYADRAPGSASPFTPPGQQAALGSLPRSPRDGGGDGAPEDDASPRAAAPEPFATPGSVAGCAAYLEPVLAELGLAQWQLRGGEPAALLNALYELVRAHQDGAAAREKTAEELSRLRLDVRIADRTIQRLQGQSEAKAQEAGGLAIKLRQLDAWYREEAERWGGEREQLARRAAQLEQRHVQFQHELRRKDGEFERLQKQLAARLSAGGRRSSGACAAAGARGTSGGGRCASSGGGARTPPLGGGLGDTRRATKAELEEMVKRAAEAHEEDRRELAADNTALRKALRELEREHADLLNAGGQPAAAPACCGADAAAAADALAAMRSRLEALRVRKQRVVGPGAGALGGLAELQAHAQSAGERLLLAKLVEASQIMEQQEAVGGGAAAAARRAVLRALCAPRQLADSAAAPPLPHAGADARAQGGPGGCAGQP